VKNIFKEIKSNYLFFLFFFSYLLIIFFFSFFRDMISDETLYFKETYLISELIRNGQWLGNYGVGIHGFLFKLPPAIIFLFSGPLVEVVTIYHIILTGIVIFLAYRLFLSLFKNKSCAVLGTMFLMTNFHLLLSSYTYLREIPALLLVLILLNYIIKRNSNNLILGLLFLLLLDAKEYVFLIFALFYIAWLFLDSEQGNIFRRALSVFKKSVIIFLPSVVWIMLMFLTPIIPVNMFLASSLGILDTGFSYLSSHFNTEVSTQNLLDGGRNIQLFIIKESWNEFLKFGVSVINILLSYIGKILYPRVFSFLSVPKVVMLPVIFCSLWILREYFFQKRKELRDFAILSLLVLIWILLFILRASHGRYLLPVVPVISVIYLYLLFKQEMTRKQKIAIAILTLFYFLAGSLFETTYTIHKLGLEMFVYLVFLIALFKPKIKIVKYFLIITISVATFATALLFSFIQGQIYGYMEYGKNRNVSDFVDLLPKDEKYWTNNIVNQSLVEVLQGNTYLLPEWKWKLVDTIKKRESLKVLGERNSYNFPILDINNFREDLLYYNIREIVFFTTEKDNNYYICQEYIDSFLESDWLELERKVDSKNMTIYIFTVNL
jgi:hypothetical protein